jgi:hypothetical protein
VADGLLNPLICPNCGAALEAPLVGTEVVTCQYCHTTFRVPHSPAPEPDLGDVILAADFSQKPITGWNLPNEDDVRLIPGARPELRANFPAKDWIYYALSSAGFLDDVDASVSLIFHAGDLQNMDAGLSLRHQKAVGSYTFQISPLGTYAVGYQEKGSDEGLDWHHIVTWTRHAAIRSGLNQVNRLRAVADAERLHFYINGVLATALHDARYDEGEVLLLAEPGANVAVDVGFMDLQLREVRKT